MRRINGQRSFESKILVCILSSFECSFRIRSNISQFDRTSGGFAKNTFLRFVIKIEFPNRKRRRFFFRRFIGDRIILRFDRFFSGVRLILIGFEASPSIATSIFNPNPTYAFIAFSGIFGSIELVSTNLNN